MALYFGVVFLFGIRPLLLREFKIQVHFAEDVFHRAGIVNNARVFAERKPLKNLIRVNLKHSQFAPKRFARDGKIQSDR